MSSPFLFKKKTILLLVAYPIIVAICKLNNTFSKESSVLSIAKQKKKKQGKKEMSFGRESGDEYGLLAVEPPAGAVRPYMRDTAASSSLQLSSLFPLVSCYKLLDLARRCSSPWSLLLSISAERIMRESSEGDKVSCIILCARGLGLGCIRVNYVFAKNLGGPWPGSAPIELRQLIMMQGPLIPLIRITERL
jgi:hypothetical protein